MSIQTSLGDLMVEPVAMGQLREGDRFVGPDESTVYIVTADCASNPNRWLHVRRLNNFRPDDQTAAFTYPLHTKLNRIV